MCEHERGRIHWSFWLIGVVALVSQMDTDSVAAMPEPYRAVIAVRPAWATIAFGVAVFSGVLGCLLLLLRHSAAYYVFIVSLLAAIVTVVHFHSVAGLDPIGAAIGSMMQVVVSVFLVWYSRWAGRRGWAIRSRGEV